MASTLEYLGTGFVAFRGISDVDLSVALAAGSAVAVSVVGWRLGTGPFSGRGRATDATVVGTSLDRNGATRNHVDPDRVDRLVDAVRTLR